MVKAKKGSGVVRNNAMFAALVAAVRANPAGYFSSSDIASHAGVSNNRHVRAWLAKLEKSGVIANDGRKLFEGGYAYAWRVTPAYKNVDVLEVMATLALVKVFGV